MKICCYLVLHCKDRLNISFSRYTAKEACMAMELIPVVGNWYQSLDHSKFEVVDVDEDEGVVAIQYYEGELDELEFDVWPSLGLTSIVEPEDWSGPFDEMERDDLGYTDMNLPPEGRQVLFEDIERDK